MTELHAGSVEAVAVRADRRGQGHGAAMMSVIERVVRSAYHLGALGASPAGARLYASRGGSCGGVPHLRLAPQRTKPAIRDRYSGPS